MPLAFVSWYAGGLEAFDLTRPAEPVRVGVTVRVESGLLVGLAVDTGVGLDVETGDDVGELVEA